MLLLSSECFLLLCLHPSSSAQCLALSQVAKLIGHKGYVKGLAFDPVGTYLASQGDDKACILWSTKNWVEAEKITDTLNYMGTSTYSQRLAWSPDGRYLALANAGIEVSKYCWRPWRS